MGQELLRDKVTEIQTIYAEFESRLRRYRDSDDDLTLASQKINATDLYTGAEIWIDGFSGFTPQEYSVIENLLPKVKRITICLCTDALEGTPEGTDVFAAVKRVYRRFLIKAKKTGVRIENPVYINANLLPRFETSWEMAHLERNFYAFPYQMYPDKTENISLFSSVNLFAEIEAAAREIIHLCRDRGMRFRDIALVARNLESYEGLVKVLFEEYEIPFFLDRKIDIENHPLVRLILSMLDIFNEQWSYEAVFRYLKTGLTGIERDRIDLIENYVLACGIKGSRWTKEEDWTMIPELLPDERIWRTIKDLNGDQSDPVSHHHAPTEFRQKTKGKKRPRKSCSPYDFLCGIQVPEKLQNMIDRFQEKGSFISQ